MNNGKIKFAPEKVWDYQAKDKTIFRYYYGEFIEVKQNNGIVIYAKTKGDKPSTTTYYISKSLDSEMLKLNSKNV